MPAARSTTTLHIAQSGETTAPKKPRKTEAQRVPRWVQEPKDSSNNSPDGGPTPWTQTPAVYIYVHKYIFLSNLPAHPNDLVDTSPPS